ncbi:MAG: NUDIX hydrolase [Bacilli bacterium]|nr:NUDIX hydrolase [Bacilli bacterium]
MSKIEKTLKNNVVFEGKVLTLNCDDVLCPNGVKATREVVHHHGGVCILAKIDDKYAFVRQYRYAYQEEILELPAGKLEKGEDPYQAGIRELEEEIGYKAESLTSYGVIYPSVGYSDERLYLYVANNIKKTETHFDLDEDLDLVLLTKEEILDKIKTNEIKDSKTICLLTKYFSNLNKI